MWDFKVNLEKYFKRAAFFMALLRKMARKLL